MRISEIIPPALADLGLRATRSVVGFTGNSPTWREVEQECDGYETAQVIETYVREATTLPYVGVEGECTMPINQRSMRLAAAFLSAQSRASDRCTDGLRVLDFGGAVGRHMIEMRRVPGLVVREWVVVESSGVVEALEHHACKGLRWIHAESPEDLKEEGQFDVVLASSVLQYMPDPRAWLGALLELAPHVIIDRAPVIDVHSHFVTRQNTRYDGRRVTYPAWFFSRQQFLEDLKNQSFEIVMEWDVAEDRPFIAGRRQANVGFLVSDISIGE